MLIRYQTKDGRNHQRGITDRMGSLHDEEDQGVEFLRGLGPSLKGATFYRAGVPFRSFANEASGVRQTNP